VEPMILNSKMQPTQMIQNYDSLIWTERFTSCGDFQLKTGLVTEFMELLPAGTRVTLRDSNIVMEVEDHIVEKKRGQAPKLSVIGRSFDSILDRRASIQRVAANEGDWQVVAKQPSDVAYFIVKWICVDGTTDPNDVFPQSSVIFLEPEDYMAEAGPNRAFTVPRGSLLTTVQNLLAVEAPADSSTSPPTPEVLPHGIRAVRPNINGTAVAMEIYTGVDRTDTIRFSAINDDIDEATYLFGKSSYANVAYVIGPSSQEIMQSVVETPSGFDRRVVLVDGSSSGVEDARAMRAEGTIALANRTPISMFDGSINEDLQPYLYGRDYGLGDLVKLAGEYGLDEIARVTEYIRSEDQNGYKAYPTLTTHIPSIAT